MKPTVVIAATALLAWSCATTPADSSNAALRAVPAELRPFFEAFGSEWAIDRDENGRVTSMTGVPSHQSLLSADGHELLPYLPTIAELPAAVELTREPAVVHLGSLTQYRYPQKIGGQPVEDADFIIQTDARGGPYDVLFNTIDVTSIPGAIRPPEDAVKLVYELVSADLHRHPPDVPDLYGEPKIEVALIDKGPHLLAIDGRVANVFEVRARATLRAEDGHDIVVALRVYSVDASTTSHDPKVIVRVRNYIHGSVTGTARVFLPNPVNSLFASGAIRAWCPPPDFDLTDPPYPEKKLQELDDPVDGEYALTGPAVHLLYDRRPPLGPKKSRTTDFSSKRGTVDFAAANVYFHISRLAQHAKDLKFDDLVRPFLKVQAFDCVTSSPQSFFIEAEGGNEPYMTFSQTRVCQIYTAEDADTIAHEYAHSLLQAKTGNKFLLDTQVKGKNEAGAINEGFADYWSLSSFAAESAAHRFKLDCYGEWAFAGRCFREYPLMSTYNDVNDRNDIHENGTVWSATLYHILSNVYPNNSDQADLVILSGHLRRFSKSTAPTMKEMAEGIVIAAGGADRAKVCEIFKTHKIWPLTCCKEKACVTNRLMMPQ